MMNPKQAMSKLVHLKNHIYIINNFGLCGLLLQNLMDNWVKFDLSNSLIIKFHQINPMGFFQNAMIHKNLRIKWPQKICVGRECNWKVKLNLLKK